MAEKNIKNTHPNNLDIPQFCISLHPGLPLLVSPVPRKSVFRLPYSVSCLLSSVFCLICAFVSSWFQVNYAKQTQFPKPQNPHNPLCPKDLRQYSPSPPSKKQTQTNPIPPHREFIAKPHSVFCLLSSVFCLQSSVSSLLSYLCLRVFVVTSQLCKTNPIPQRPKLTQPLMPHGFTPIFRSTQPQKTNPNKPILPPDSPMSFYNTTISASSACSAVKNTARIIHPLPIAPESGIIQPLKNPNLHRKHIWPTTSHNKSNC
jgi:hypothetical protein